jgi:hypothetical protein
MMKGKTFCPRVALGVRDEIFMAEFLERVRVAGEVYINGDELVMKYFGIESIKLQLIYCSTVVCSYSRVVWKNFGVVKGYSEN